MINTPQTSFPKLLFTLIVTTLLTACKPQLEELTITDKNGEALSIEPAFDPEITEYTLSEDYTFTSISVQSTPSSNTQSHKVYSNRFATDLIDPEELYKDEGANLYVAKGTNKLAVNLKNNFGTTTYHITINRPYWFQQTIQDLFETTLTDHYEGEAARYPQWNVGLSAAIHLPNGVFFSTTRGINKWGGDEAITDEHLFPVASMTKSFIAALALQIANESDIYGLSLDDTIIDWLDEEDLPDPVFIPREITLHQLLKHSSGLPRQAYTMESVIDNLLINWTAEEWIKRRELLAYPIPDSDWNYDYADINYWLAGVMLDRAIKQVDPNSSVIKEIRKRFIEPLNLKDTYFAQENFPVHRLVRGHFYDASNFLGGGMKRNPLHVLPFLNSTDRDIVRKASYAGGMVSTAADMARWYSALLHIQTNAYRNYGIYDAVSEIVERNEQNPFYLGGDGRQGPQPGYGVVRYTLTGSSPLVFATQGDLALYSGQMSYILDNGAVIVLLENRGYELGGQTYQRPIQAAVIEALEPYMGSLSFP